MRFTFTVEVEAERVSGKFVSREDLASQIEEALSDADPAQLSVDDSEYETTDWSITEEPQPRRRKAAH